MPITFGVFRNDGDDGDRGDRDLDDGSAFGGGAATPGAQVNPLLAQALWHTRGDLTNGRPPADERQFDSGMGRLPTKDIFARWSPEVRAYLYSFDLLSGLHFKADETGEEASLLSLTVDKGGTPSFSRPFARVMRPDYDKHQKALADELAKVMTAIALQPERMAEILTQVQVPYAFFAAVMNLQAGRHRYTYELMSTVFRLSSTVVMQFKNHLKVRRPADRSPLVQPVLPTPGHASFPAGHSTQCHFVATVLKALLAEALNPVRTKELEQLPQQLDSLAARVAENRVVAGLHYPADNEAGKTLGIALAGYFLQRARERQPTALAWLWGRALEEWKNT